MNRRKLTRRQLTRYVGGGFLAAIAGAGIGIAATHLGWLITLTATAALAALAVLVYLAARAWRRATRRTDWIFRTELGNPDPFQGQHGNNHTDTGETR